MANSATPLEPPFGQPSPPPRHLGWREKLYAYVQLTRFDKPVGIELVFWSTLWAVFLAGQELHALPPWHIVLAFGLGAILMRAAGCAINDFADRKVDGQVARTHTRPLADGRLTGKEAVGAFLVLSLVSAGLLFFLPVAVFYWSLGALVLAFIYPFMKRFTHLPQLFLAAAFGWAIPMAYVAVLNTPAINMVGSTAADINHLPNVWCWLLFLGYMCWTVAYDTQYAMVDRDDDVKVGIKSTAILFGKNDVRIIALLQLAFGLCLWGVLGHYFGVWTGVLLLPLIAMFGWQNRRCLSYQPSECFRAFLANVWVGRYVFLLIVILCWLNSTKPLNI